MQLDRPAIARWLLLLSLAPLQHAQGAARSVKVIIKNDTDRSMAFASGSAAHGKVTANPPSRIPPSGIGELFAESDGVATGTEGTVTYTLDGVGGMATFHWDNPFVGSNSASGTAPPGYEVQQIGDAGNRTLIFFSIHPANHPVASCNPDWVIAHLGTHAEDRLDGFDRDIGFVTTPFKRMGIGGWVDTGCDAVAWGWPVREAQHSTDGFWTIDVELQQFSISRKNIPANQQRYVRIEVEPKTPAHNSADAKANRLIEFHGHVLIDTHHGDELIEVHPWEPIKLRGPNPPNGGYTQSCRDQWVDGANLCAICRKRDGGWANAALNDVGHCVGDISNEDGKLVCAPKGGYKQSCRDISTAGGNLRANCQARNGVFVNTVLNNYARCVGDISNQDGTLRCDTGSPAPNGGYKQSCRDISSDGTNLRASCKNRGGAWVNTTLTNYRRCVGDISNQDGTLRCDMNVPAPNGGYKQSCRDISSDGTNLRAACKNRGGAWVNTILTNYRRCVGDISNQDGRLQCNMR